MNLKRIDKNISTARITYLPNEVYNRKYGITHMHGNMIIDVNYLPRDIIGVIEFIAEHIERVGDKVVIEYHEEPKRND